MEEVVAIQVTDARGRRHFFVTWGRAFDAVDPKPLLGAVRKRLDQFGIKLVRDIAVCPTLRTAATQPYFYEALLTFSQQKVPSGKSYARWSLARRKRIAAGKEIYYLGLRDGKST